MSDGRTERARAQREQREAQILAAALEVFARQGYHGASISDLVEAAGVARGTFYLYFDSKNAVFLALLDQLLVGFRGGIDGADTRPGAPPLPDQLVQIVAGVLHATRAARAVASILFREATVLDADVQARVRGFEDTLYAYLRNSLVNGVRLGLLRPHDPEIVATCVYGSVRQVIDRYIVTADTDHDLDAIARDVVGFALRGLLPAPESSP